MKLLVNKYYGLALLALFLLSSCASLPPNTHAPQTYALQDTDDTQFGKKSSALRQGTEKNSGFFLLSNGLDAFAARAGLARYAEKSIDAQYYMIHDDLTGILFVGQLIQAADRGIRVRVLIDDMDLEHRDQGLVTVATHPNIELRVFNPFSRSLLRKIQFLTRFGSVTRRMHNKSFTVDNQVTIVGGRNIGNEYFDADPHLAFADLDILAIGAVVKEVSSSFDEYWNSSLSYPIETLRPDLVAEVSPVEELEKLREYMKSDAVQEYKRKLIESDLFKRIQTNAVAYSLGNARVLSDHPDKLIGYDSDYSLTLASQFDAYFKSLQKEVFIFSPYFVPGKIGTEYLCNLSRSGIKVRIFTNSLASTDVGIVHAGYAKYRTALLRAGVELYEMNKVLSSREREAEDQKGDFGSSKASLHAKSFVFDREKVFIGSLNLDPRSVVENTEIGIMVYSAELAETMATGFDYMTENMAFRLELVTDDEGIEYINWYGLDRGKEKIWKTDPFSSVLQRTGIFFLGILPIESQL